jgi:serpin B
MKKNHRASALALCGLLALGCKPRPQDSSHPKVQDLAASPAQILDQEAAAQSGAALALDLYARLASRPGNLLFSPHSLFSALAMAYGGAAGGTALEMASTLHLDLPPERLHAAMGGIGRQLEEGALGGGYTLSVAEGLWGQKGASLLPGFLELLNRRYGASLNELDLQKDPEGSRGTINAWAAQKTGGQISGLIGPGVLDASTRLVLTDSVYFKGRWATQFKEGMTKDQPFYGTPGKDSQAPLMTQSKDFGYMETGSFQALEMPYLGQDVSLVAFLPRQHYGLADFEKTLSTATLQDWLARLRTREVEVFFPKFKISTPCELSDELQALGLREAFSEAKADFSAMDGQHDLFLSKFIEEAFVRVDEEGTEAGAATAVVAKTHGAVSAPPLFRADHPFLFLIRDRRSGAILFLGRVVDPTQ